jgi:hypothetical protein
VHVIALVLFAAVAFVRYRGSAFAPVVSFAWPFIIVNLALAVLWCGTAFYHSQSLLDPIQEIVLVGVFVAVAATIRQGAVDPSSRILEYARWAASVSVVSVALALWLSLKLNGVNPMSVFSKVLTTGDPQILERDLFRSAFTGFGFDAETARANMRHEIFGAVLVSMYLSMVAVRLRPLRSGWAAAAYRASLLLGTALIVASLSRAVTIAAAGIPVLAAYRALRSGRISTRQIAVGFGGVIGVLLLAATGFLGVVWDRFTRDTSSYEARDSLLHQALTNVNEHFLTGGVDTLGASSHDLVLDAWLRSGVFAALLAAVVLVLVIAQWAVLILQLPRAPEWMFPVTAAMALPVVRMLTAGGGTIPPSEWVCLAVVAAFLSVRALHSSQLGEPPAAPLRPIGSLTRFP